MTALPLAPSRRRLLPLAAIVLAMALACTDAANEAAKQSSAVAGEELSRATSADMVAGGQARASREFAAMAPVPETQGGPKLPGETAGTTMLIRRGDVSIRVDSIEPAIAALRRLAGSLGGTIGNVSITAGDFEVRRATLELRIPSARFDDAMGGLSPIGKVEQSSVSAEDVGEEYVDVRARVTNAQRLETRLVDLLATRTGKLEDVLAVERELARVREEIERYEGRLRFLGARVATSTISVTVSEREPVVGDQPGRSVLGEAFVQAWRNFVGLVAWVIRSLGVLVPAGLLLWGLARWWRGRRRGSAND